MLGPIIAQRHQQLLAKFGSVGTVWRKLFENPKAQCLLGCLSQFGFGGTGGFDYAQLGMGGGGEDEGAADPGSCEPASGSSSSSSSSGVRAASASPSSVASAAAAAFSLPPGFDLSAMSQSDMKAAAASMGISLPDGFKIPALPAFGRSAGAGGSMPSASLPRPPHAATPSLSQFTPAFGLAPPSSGWFTSLCLALIDRFRPSDLFGLLTPDAGKKLAVERLEQVRGGIGIALHRQRANCDFPAVAQAQYDRCGI